MQLIQEDKSYISNEIKLSFIDLEDDSLTPYFEGNQPIFLIKDKEEFINKINKNSTIDTRSGVLNIRYKEEVIQFIFLFVIINHKYSFKTFFIPAINSHNLFYSNFIKSDFYHIYFGSSIEDISITSYPKEQWFVPGFSDIESFNKCSPDTLENIIYWFNNTSSKDFYKLIIDITNGEISNNLMITPNIINTNNNYADNQTYEYFKKPTMKSFVIASFSAFMLAKITSLTTYMQGSEIQEDELSWLIEPVNNVLSFLFIDKIGAIPFFSLSSGFSGTAHLLNYLLTYIPIFFILLNFKYSVNKAKLFINKNENLKKMLSSTIEKIKHEYNEIFKSTPNENEMNIVLIINNEEYSYTFDKRFLLEITPELKLEKITFGIHSGELWFNLPLDYLDWGFGKFEGNDQNMLCTCLKYHYDKNN